MLRGALIGAGNAAMNAHVPAFCDDPWLRRRVEIVAAADLSRQNLAALATRLPLHRAYPDAEVLFEAEHLDFVDICTPPDSRLSIIRQCAERECHIICEKPLASTWSDAVEIRRAVAGHPIVFTACHQYRFSPTWRIVHRLLAQEAIGEVRFAEFNVWRTQADPGSVNWRAGWRRNATIAGGGILLDIGWHYFYLVCSLFGLPRRITARTGRLVHGAHEVEDTAFVILEYPSRFVRVNLTWAAARRENRSRVVGSGGIIDISDEAVVLDRPGSPRRWELPAGLGKASYAGWYSRLFRRFVHQVERMDSSTESLDEAVNVMRLADLCYRSAATDMSYAFSPSD